MVQMLSQLFVPCKRKVKMKHMRSCHHTHDKASTNHSCTYRKGGLAKQGIGQRLRWPIVKILQTFCTTKSLSLLKDTSCYVDILQHLPQTSIPLKRRPNIRSLLQDGVYIKGLFLQGAGWDKKGACLVEAEPMQLVCPIPTIHFRPVENKKKSQKGNLIFLKSQINPMLACVP